MSSFDKSSCDSSSEEVPIFLEQGSAKFVVGDTVLASIPVNGQIFPLILELEEARLEEVGENKDMVQLGDLRTPNSDPENFDSFIPENMHEMIFLNKKDRLVHNSVSVGRVLGFEAKILESFLKISYDDLKEIRQGAFCHNEFKKLSTIERAQDVKTIFIPWDFIMDRSRENGFGHLLNFDLAPRVSEVGRVIEAFDGALIVDQAIGFQTRWFLMVPYQKHFKEGNPLTKKDVRDSEIEFDRLLKSYKPFFRQNGDKDSFKFCVRVYETDASIRTFQPIVTAGALDFALVEYVLDMLKSEPWQNMHPYKLINRKVSGTENGEKYERSSAYWFGFAVPTHKFLFLEKSKDTPFLKNSKERHHASDSDKMYVSRNQHATYDPYTGRYKLTKPDGHDENRAVWVPRRGDEILIDVTSTGDNSSEKRQPPIWTKMPSLQQLQKLVLMSRTKRCQQHVYNSKTIGDPFTSIAHVLVYGAKAASIHRAIVTNLIPQDKSGDKLFAAQLKKLRKYRAKEINY